jgi:hypothetical protein
MPIRELALHMHVQIVMADFNDNHDVRVTDVSRLLRDHYQLLAGSCKALEQTRALLERSQSAIFRTADMLSFNQHRKVFLAADYAKCADWPKTAY